MIHSLTGYLMWIQQSMLDAEVPTIVANNDVKTAEDFPAIDIDTIGITEVCVYARTHALVGKKMVRKMVFRYVRVYVSV